MRSLIVFVSLIILSLLFYLGVAYFKHRIVRILVSYQSKHINLLETLSIEVDTRLLNFQNMLENRLFVQQELINLKSLPLLNA